MDLISELKRKQQKEPLIYESDRDGAIEDIITGEGIARSLSCLQSVLRHSVSVPLPLPTTPPSLNPRVSLYKPRFSLLCRPG